VKVSLKCKECSTTYGFLPYRCKVADETGAAAGAKLCTPFEVSEETKEYCKECKDKGKDSFLGKLKKTCSSTKCQVGEEEGDSDTGRGL
jgi:hypothetical protein